MYFKYMPNHIELRNKQFSVIYLMRFIESKNYEGRIPLWCFQPSGAHNNHG